MNEIPNKETLYSLLDWLVRNFHEEIKPFEAIHDNYNQTCIWHCFGCCGEFLSKFPHWERPTLKTFLHTPNCRYVQLMKLFPQYE